MQNLFMFLVLSCSLRAVLSVSPCEKLLNELAEAQSDFVKCNTHHAKPINDARLCVGCKITHDNMLEKYGNLMKDQNCSKQFIDLDRLNIVYSTESMLHGLWQRANCDDCFIGTKVDNLTAFHLELKGCLDEYHRKVPLVCQKCALQYLKMNDFYTNLDKQNKGKICYDMQDLMNNTRVEWSQRLNCCKREVKLTMFLISVGLVTVLPIMVFYSTAVLLTKRREANHGLLNEQQPELDAPSTSQLISAALLSTYTEPPTVMEARNEKIAKVLQMRAEDSSSDEEMIVKPKTS